MQDPKSAFDLRKFPPNQRDRFVKSSCREEPDCRMSRHAQAEDIEALWAYVLTGGGDTKAGGRLVFSVRPAGKEKTRNGIGQAHGQVFRLSVLAPMRLKEDAGAQAILSAIPRGLIGHLDTAAYTVMKKSRRGDQGVGVPRKGIFLTTKVRDNNLKADDFARSVDNSLKLLGLSSVDSVLIHWPNSNVPAAKHRCA